MLTAMDIRNEMARLMDAPVRDVVLRYNHSEWHSSGELVMGICTFSSAIKPFELGDFLMELPEFSKRFLIPAMHNLVAMKERK